MLIRCSGCVCEIMLLNFSVGQLCGHVAKEEKVNWD